MKPIPKILPDMHIRLDEKGLPFICSGGFAGIHLDWISSSIYSHFP